MNVTFAVFAAETRPGARSCWNPFETI